MSTREPHASYDAGADAMAVVFAPPGARYVESAEIAPGLILDYDQHNRVIGVEILGVQNLLDNGRTPSPGTEYLLAYAAPPLEAVLDRYAAAFQAQDCPTAPRWRRRTCLW